MLKRITVFVVAVMFALVSLPVAAYNRPDLRVAPACGVTKDTHGKCHVILLRPIELEKGGVAHQKIDAGPFATKEEAIRAAEETCSSLPTPEPAQWVVNKDKNGRCRVVPTKSGATPETVAGPFAKKNEAQKALKETCPPAENKK